MLLSGSAGGPLKLTALKGDGLMVGAVDGLDYSAKTVALDPVNRLYLYSDGAVEIHLPDGSTWTTKGFLDFMGQPAPGGVSLVDHLIEHITTMGNSASFADDVSVLELAWES